MAFGLAGLWIKRLSPPAEDPKLSRGLQLLQTKISVLEDLSDRTENQVHQLTALMEIKVKEIQAQIFEADKHLQQMDVARTKSLEVAKIFQDRIPHSEIIERQNTMKYIRAARMAHQGRTVDEIASVVDLSRGEIEFIAKVNRDRLQFSEADLPEWTNEGTNEGSEANLPAQAPMSPPAAFVERPAAIEPQALQRTHEAGASPLSELGQRFRQAISEANTQNFNRPAPDFVPAVVVTPKNLRPSIAEESENVQVGWNTKGEFVEVKKVVFPRMQNKDRN